MSLKLKPVNVGVIGCGNISDAYFGTFPRYPITKMAAVADMIPERAQAKAEKYGIAKAYSVAEMLADPEIEIVLNLTIPNAHYDVSMQAVRAGKNVYNEKPLCITRAEGAELIAEAKKRNLLVGCAPDTVLGGGHQICRSLINSGAIGSPVGVVANMLCHGHESWHPAPEFYYKVGGGPMFDMGPYYLTALVTMLGPVKKVAGLTRITFPERTITSEPLNGTKVTVDVPTHVTGLLLFENGAIGNITTSFDVWAANMPCIEVFGTEGSLSLPDPNGFGGVPKIKKQGDADWSEVEWNSKFSEGSRGLGVADMAYSIRTGRPHRASGAIADHVLEIMHAIHTASSTASYVDITSTFAIPNVFPEGLEAGMLDE